MLAELEKLEANLGGVADLKRQPDAIFIVDLKKEQLAVREARRLNLPIIALVDTNCDPDEADFIIPGNDDAIRSCSLIVRAIAEGIAAGQSKVTERELPEAPTDGAAANGAAPAADEASSELTSPEHEQLSQGESTVEPEAPSPEAPSPEAPSAATGEAAADEPNVIAAEAAPAETAGETEAEAQPAVPTTESEPEADVPTTESEAT